MPKICFPDLRGPVRVLGLWIIRGFQRRDTDYWPLNLKITDDFFLESYVRDTLFTKLGSGLFPNLPRIMDYSDPPPPPTGSHLPGQQMGCSQCVCTRNSTWSIGQFPGTPTDHPDHYEKKKGNVTA